MSNHKIVFISRVVVILPGISKYFMLSWQLHGTTRERNFCPHKNIFNVAAIVMDDISSDSGILCDSKLYHSYFWYNMSFIDPPLGKFDEIFPSVMIFPSG